MPTFGLLDLGTPELIIILAIVLLLFGGKKLPELSRSMGQSLKELRSGLNDAPSKPAADTAKTPSDKPTV